MQCASCRFQNMPGTAMCGRCGTSLGLAIAVIDVHPPRARPLTKRLRRQLPIRRAVYGVRDVVASAGTAVAGRRMMLALPPAPIFLRLIVPGWSHFHAGQRVRGHLFLWAFLACLLPGLLFWGTGWGSVLLGLAFSVHSSAALDVVMLTFVDCGLRKRLARSVYVSVLVGVAIYWPAGRLLTGFADPQVVSMKITGFDPGDVVLVNHWATPAPGRIVLYDIPQYTVGERDGHRAVNVFYRGDRIERVLAGPGDSVRWEKGRLFVNGEPAPWLPLDARRAPTRLELTIPPDHFFILPSTTVNLPGPDQVPAWAALSVVPRESVRGLAYARSQPLSRFEVIR
jgi:hypothetical protein